MKFHDDEIECYLCNDFVEPGDEYFRFDNKSFCCAECLGEYLIENLPGVEKRHCYTAEDRRLEYGDILYDRWRDEHD